VINWVLIFPNIHDKERETKKLLLTQAIRKALFLPAIILMFDDHVCAASASNYFEKQTAYSKFHTTFIGTPF